MPTAIKSAADHFTLRVIDSATINPTIPPNNHVRRTIGPTNTGQAAASHPRPVNLRTVAMPAPRSYWFSKDGQSPRSVANDCPVQNVPVRLAIHVQERLGTKGIGKDQDDRKRDGNSDIAAMHQRSLVVLEPSCSKDAIRDGEAEQR